MRKEKRILKILSQVDEKYIEEAAPGKKADKRTGWIKWASVAACFVVLMVVVWPFYRNDIAPPMPGETDFPTAAPMPGEADLPPETTQMPEQTTPPMVINANGLHLVQLVYGAQTTPDISTDFIIHINPKSYTSYEKNGVYVIRPRDPLSEEFPECSMKIYRIAGVTPAAAAESIREKLTASYFQVSEIGDSAVMGGLFLHGDNGSTWNAEQIDVTITDDLLGGCYIIAARYFTEAAEGHGVRFADMTGTFKAVTSADAAAMPAYLVELNRTITAFAPAFFSDHVSGTNDVLAQDAMIATYGTDVTDDVNIASVDYSISGDESPTAAVVSVKHRISTEDSYHYLTIELTYNPDGSEDRWNIHFAGIEK